MQKLNKAVEMNNFLPSVAAVLQQTQWSQQQKYDNDMQYLALLDTVRIKKRFQAAEVVTGFEQKNQYGIYNANDEEFLFAQEESECFSRQCCGEVRPFELNIYNITGGQPMQLKKSCHTSCLQKMDIYYPLKQKIATIEEVDTCCVPKFKVSNSMNEILFYIQGDCCYCKCCVDIIFQVSREDGITCGEIRKHWGGCREICGGAIDFSIHFEMNEPVVNKVILLGSAFLVDFVYFEDKIELIG